MTVPANNDDNGVKTHVYNTAAKISLYKILCLIPNFHPAYIINTHCPAMESVRNWYHENIQPVNTYSCAI
jgi:hypothetical protein